MFLITDKPVSPAGKVNTADLKSIARSAAIFFAAPVLMYLGQLQGELNELHIVKDFMPSIVTLGAIEGWAIGIVINFFLRLSNSEK